MQAALTDLAATAPGRRVAVLGDMLELGPDERRFHADLGPQARDAGVAVLVTVGPLAAHAVPGDTVLVKGSRGVGLEGVAERLAGRDG